MIGLLVQHLAICALLAMLVGIACRVGKLRPAVAHLLWLVVLVRLVVPPVVTWPWNAPDLGMASSLPTTSEILQAEAPSYRDAWDGVEVAPAAPPAVDRTTGKASAVSDPWAIAGIWALATWITGGVFLAAMQVLWLRRFNRVLHTQEDPPEWLASEAAELAGRFALATPRLRVVDGIESPLFYGWRRPAVLIPRTLVDAIPRDQWKGVLAHELAHWKRRDHWVRGLELVAGCLWWWNPVYWFVRHHLRHTAELACDAWVVWTMPDARKTYAKTLVDISEMIALGDRPAAALGIGHGSRRSFERRLSMVMRSTGRARASALGLVSGLLLLALSIPVFAGAESEPTSPNVQAAQSTATSPPDPALSEEIQKALESEISIEFEDEHITRILGFIAEYVGTNFVIDYRVVQPPSNEGSSGTAPTANANPQDLGYTTDGIIPGIRLEKVPLYQALNALCTLLDLAYEPRPEYIWISTEEMIARTDFATPYLGNDEDIEKKLEAEIAIEFESEHLAAILEFIADYTDTNIVIDKNAVPPPALSRGGVVPAQGLPAPPAAQGGPLSSPPPALEAPEPETGGRSRRNIAEALPRDQFKWATTNGYEMTGYVPYIRLNGVTFNESLKALLLPLNLTYRVESGWIFVTRPPAP